MDPATAVAASGVGMFKILEMVLNMGPMGVVLMIWYFDKQKVDDILRKYTEDMQEMRDMYVTNAALVKRYEDLAGDLKEVVILNTQAMTRLVDRISKEVKA